MPLKTPLTELLGIRHPILLAPMGSIAGGALAAAVTRAGGLGLIGAGYGDPAWIERELAAAGNERIGIGFITWSLAKQPELLTMVLDRKPVLLFLSFGDARPFIPPIQASGVKLALQVQSLAQAREAKSLGADLIVAQGTEAGGHGTIHRSLFPLLPAIVDAVAPVPVLAAGGISEGRQLAAVLLLGAAGALVGTRFFAAEESLGHANAKARILAAGGDDTIRTTIFDTVRGYDWPTQYTGRAIANVTTSGWHGREHELKAVLPAEKARYAAAAADANFDRAVIFAGEGLDLVSDIRPAADIVGAMTAAAEAEALLRRAPGFVAPD